MEEAILLYGIIENDGKILKKQEKDFIKEERKNIEAVIEKTIINYIESLLSESKLDIDNIEKIGIAAPRNKYKWNNCKSRKFRNKEFSNSRNIKKTLQNKEYYIK